MPTSRAPAIRAMLALDCGTHTGWAYGHLRLDCSWSLAESGVQVFDQRRGESPGLRFARFRAWLDEIGDIALPALVLYEQAHHRGGAATELAVGMTTRVVEWAATRGIEHAAVHSATLKKHATGSGRAEKDAMIRAASATVGRPIGGHDEADAICLLRYGMESFRP